MPLIIWRTANRRRLAASSFRKLAARPPIFALFQDGIERARLLVAAEDGAAHQAIEILAAANHRVECLEVLGDLVERIFLKRELEQGRRIAAGHAGDDRVSAAIGFQ